MIVLLQILIAVFIVSLISLVGIFLFLKEKVIKKYLFYLVSFAAGSLLGAAFLDLLPEAFESGFKESVPVFIIITEYPAAQLLAAPAMNSSVS